MRLNGEIFSPFNPGQKLTATAASMFPRTVLVLFIEGIASAWH
jgi:hypothetical protein